MARARFVGAAAAALVAAATAGGCLQILGDDVPFVLGTGGSGGDGGAGATAGNGGAGGAGGDGGGTMVCMPNEARSCYSGPEDTEGVGECKAGTETCSEDGTWGACTGEVGPGVETCASKEDEDCDGNECARWSRISGGRSLALRLGTKTDSKGNVILFGVFGGVLTIGGATVDDSTGGIFLAKLDTMGNAIWLKNFGPSTASADFPSLTAMENLAIDASDNIVITGNFEGSLDLGGGAMTADGKDFFVAKFTPNGIHAWSRAYGGAMNQEVSEIAADNQGDLLVAGTYDNGFLIGGSSPTGAGVYVARLSASNGNVTSVMHVDPNVGEHGAPLIAVGSDGTWALAGDCNDGALIGTQTLATCDRFVAKLGADNELKWVRNVPAQVDAVAFDSAGAVVMLGAFKGTVDMGTGPITSQGSSDLVIAKLAARDGAAQWVRAFGGPGSDEYGDLVLDPADRIYVGFCADDSIDFGGGLLESAGLSDAFVVALDAEGNHRWSRVFGDPTSQISARLAGQGAGLGLVLSVQLMAGEIDFGAGVMTSENLAIAVAELSP